MKFTSISLAPLAGTNNPLAALCVAVSIEVRRTKDTYFTPKMIFYGSCAFPPEVINIQFRARAIIKFCVPVTGVDPAFSFIANRANCIFSTDRVWGFVYIAD
jgi:hypothetical protein